MSANRLHIVLIILLSFFFSSFDAFTQISHGGLPQSFNLPNKNYSAECIEVKANYDSINEFSKTRCTDGCSLHVGSYITSCYKSDQLQGSWQLSPDGSYFYSITFHLKNAKAVGISFSDISIPEGSKLFLFNKSLSSVRGSYISENINEDGSFTIEPVEGEYVTIEFDNLPSKNVNFTIEGLSYFFDYSCINTTGNGYGSSGECEVNINCSSGESVREPANAVLRLLLLYNTGWYYCTASLINNALQDAKPYVLTAWHCGKNAPQSDLNKWIYYFLYEGNNCDNPTTEPEHKTLVGCSHIASADYYDSENNVGSDFYLALLNDNYIPSDYYPFFAGWDVSDNVEQTAKCVHHPSGDIKKVSYTDNISSNCFAIENYSIKTHWKVVWADTESGHGVTEGGSSGSPLFNSRGQIIGTLSGGNASCKNLYGSDYFGKMSFSWNRNGSSTSRRLDKWLDPDNYGITSIDGYSPDTLSVRNISIYLNNNKITNNIFSVDNTVIFSADYYGKPDSCKWEFEGGIPSSITVPAGDSVPVKYSTIGKFNVDLTLITHSYSIKTHYDNFLSVVPSLFPNPFSDLITVVTGENFSVESVDSKLIDINGKIAAAPTQTTVNQNIINFYFPKISQGHYILYTNINNIVNTFHVVRK